MLREKLLANGDLSDILTAVVDKAKAGDIPAAALLLDRVWPRLRPVSPVVKIDLPAGDLVAKADAAVEAMAAGLVPPDQMQDFLGAFEKAARLLETTELMRRLEALEAKFLKEMI